MNVVELLAIIGIVVVALLTIGLMLSRLYHRASKEVSFVRTGFRGQKVIINGGAMVLPVLHYLKMTPEGADLLAPRANIARWQAAIDERESAAATVPEFG